MKAAMKTDHTMGNTMQLKNILYATDLSFSAERALPYAHEIARRYGATIQVVHAIQRGKYPSLPPAAWPTEAHQEEIFRQESKADLDQALQDVPHKMIFRTGPVADVIDEVMHEVKSDLLVMSTQGSSAVENVILGSMAEKMFRHTRCPVLTVGPAVAAKPRNTAELNRILYATDFSTESLAAAPLAISLAQEHRALLLLLHCVEQNGESPAIMRRTLADLVPYGVELRTAPLCMAETGHPATKILEVAESHGVDLIVLGIHASKNPGAEPTQRLHRGVLRIATEAKCPVLTVCA